MLAALPFGSTAQAQPARAIRAGGVKARAEQLAAARIRAEALTYGLTSASGTPLARQAAIDGARELSRGLLLASDATAGRYRTARARAGRLAAGLSRWGGGRGGTSAGGARRPARRAAPAGLRPGPGRGCWG
jgi:hypothetical protein